MTTTIKKVTEAKLVKYLEKIGWSIRGNILNRNIINDFGEPTLFYIEGGYDGSGGTRIEIRRQPFGRSFSGSFQLEFKDMWMQYMSGRKTDTFLSLIFPKGNSARSSGSFISFYPVKIREESDSTPPATAEEGKV